jgi:hypothetical protein
MSAEAVGSGAQRTRSVRYGTFISYSHAAMRRLRGAFRNGCRPTQSHGGVGGPLAYSATKQTSRRHRRSSCATCATPRSNSPHHRKSRRRADRRTERLQLEPPSSANAPRQFVGGEAFPFKLFAESSRSERVTVRPQIAHIVVVQAIHGYDRRRVSFSVLSSIHCATVSISDRYSAVAARTDSGVRKPSRFHFVSPSTANSARLATPAAKPSLGSPRLSLPQ